MLVPVVQIRHMWMLVHERRVRVAMTVNPSGLGLMSVVVMAIIMRMGVLMLQGLMRVLVVVGLNQMQDHSRQHQYASQDQQYRRGALFKSKSTQCANKRSEREHRARACSPECALSEQIEAKAQTIASGANAQQHASRQQTRHGLHKQHSEKDSRNDAQA